MLERINLVPARPIAAKLKRAAPPVLGALLGVILLFVAGKYSWLSFQLNSTVKELARLTAKAESAAQFQVQQDLLSKELASLSNQMVQLKSEVARLTEPRGQRSNFSTVLSRIATALPGSAKCRAIVLHAGSGEIEGVATEYKDLPDFVAALKKDGLCKQATLHDIDRAKAESGSRFSYKIIFELN